MGYFSNNKEVTFQEMKKNTKYKEVLKNEGIEFDNLIEILINREYEQLYSILNTTVRKKESIMEPILYSVKNEYGTYQIYKYCGENIQEDKDIAREVVKDEPELIMDTYISNNKEYILELVEINPEVVKHMSQTLKNDAEFIEVLCEINNKEIMANVAKECKMPDTIMENPELANNKEFMVEAIKQEPRTLAYAPKELKNDYKFIKEASKDRKVIDYIVENTNNFGEQGLIGAKESLVEISSNDAISGFKAESQKIKEEIKQKEKDGDSNELSELLKRDKQLERHAKFFEKIKNGEVDPVKVARLMDKLCKNMDPEYRKELKQVLKIDEAIVERQKENKEKEMHNEENEKTELNDIETKVETASFEGIKEETEAIRKEIEYEKSKLDKIGEKTNDDAGERA